MGISTKMIYLLLHLPNLGNCTGTNKKFIRALDEGFTFKQERLQENPKSPL